MSLTDYRRIIDTLGGGFISIECSDGKHVQLGVNIGMSIGVYVDLAQLHELILALIDAKAVIRPNYPAPNADS